MTSESTEFQLGHPQSEHETLSVLSRTFQTFTRQQFAEAGLKEGMSVLEIGSGGDVALIAGEFVGRSGSVVGIEQSRAAVDYATHHAAVRGLDNVKFIEAHIEQDLPFDTQFDALVGRIILMFLPSPAVTLRRLARHVRPGGTCDLSGTGHVMGEISAERPVRRAGGRVDARGLPSFGRRQRIRP